MLLIGKERHDVGRPKDYGYPIRGIVKDGWMYLRNYRPELLARRESRMWIFYGGRQSHKNRSSSNPTPTGNQILLGIGRLGKGPLKNFFT